MRAIGASEKMPSVSAGRMSCFEARHESLGVARDQAVDQIEAGDLRRRREEHVEPAERRRRPAEQVVEDVDQDQAGEEHRQRDAGGCDDPADMVDQRIRPRRRDDAERHRDDDARRTSRATSVPAEAGSRLSDLAATGWPVVSELPRLPWARSTT